MSTSSASFPPVDRPWISPWTALLDADQRLARAADGTLALAADTPAPCPVTAAALALRAARRDAPRGPTLDGQPLDAATAHATAARWLAQARQPLIAGLAADVDGQRALFRLAAACGAVSDPVGGAAWAEALMALQDRGQFTTTLSEVRERADLLLFLGSTPEARLPSFLRRAGLDGAPSRAAHAGSACPVPAGRKLRVLGAPTGEALAALGATALGATALEGADLGELDLFDALAQLNALAAGRVARDATPALQALAAELQAAQYAVLVYEPSKLPAQGGLLIEAVQRLVGTLNAKGRAASLPLSGHHGLATAHYAHTWLSGLPLRTRVGPLGLEHEPRRHDASRLIATGGADLLLWVAAFGNEPAAPAAAGLPRIALVPPGAPVPEGTGPLLVIPVGTPGLDHAGHLFRSEGTTVLHLPAGDPSELPPVGTVVAAVAEAMAGASAPSSPHAAKAPA
ncbi:molybdopterin-binding domain-containing protein [Aquariibacter albus]|uniref:Formylmethanofuran dehydrogenase n=1 Tax=Aquariibacter albus TaxID=2759899 RepID=A0A839HRD7_9BURK|nr:formylmethanofuran dehydrogenase [Aquariibacter albus]MBB1161621.1 formylmethanofuran dehydrogenase [Aquariibacter albus]